jgi:hypothetical protein
VRELEHPPLLLLGDTRARQQGTRVVRPQVSQRHHTQQVAPPRIPPPRPLRSVPARDHDQRGPWQRRHELLPQPILERHRPLEGVEQQRDRLATRKHLPRRRLNGPPHRPKLGHERPRRRLDRTQIKAHDSDPGIRGRLGERAQQRSLANSAGTVEPQHAERRFRRSERPYEQLELRRASHEPPPPRTLQAVSHRRDQRGLVGILRRTRNHRLIQASLTATHRRARTRTPCLPSVRGQAEWLDPTARRLFSGAKPQRMHCRPRAQTRAGKVRAQA